MGSEVQKSEGDVLERVGGAPSDTAVAGADSDELGLADTVDPELWLARGSLPPGTVLEGTYRIGDEIGRGGMGAVYRAEHVTLGRPFAVKIVGAADHFAAEAVARLIQEARTASSMEHENIVDVTHLGTDPETGLVFVVMELLRGEDLRTRLSRVSKEGEPWLADDEVRRLAPPLLSALGAAHAAGVVHRDLKPENVFLAEKGAREVVKVVDFGMSKLSAGESSVRLTRTGQMIGTPLYMPPEQSRDGGEVDARADVYSLGVMLYEMLAGDVPFPAETIYACVLAHATQEPPPLGARRPDLPSRVVDVVMRCLAKDPADRFEDGGALLAAWEAAWGSEAPAVEAKVEPVVEPVPAPLAREEPSTGARGRLALGLGAVLLLGLVAGGWAMTREPEIPAPPPVAVAAAPAPAAPPALAVTPPAVEAPPPAEVAPAPPVTRSVTVVSEPAGAEVSDGDSVLGVTPYALELSGDAPPRSLTLRLRGRRPATVEVSGASPDRVETTLRRTSARPTDDLAGW